MTSNLTKHEKDSSRDTLDQEIVNAAKYPNTYACYYG